MRGSHPRRHRRSPRLLATALTGNVRGAGRNTCPASPLATVGTRVVAKALQALRLVDLRAGHAPRQRRTANHLDTLVSSKVVGNRGVSHHPALEGTGSHGADRR